MAIVQFEGELQIAYFLISIFRGLFLIPSTPFVLLGIALFSDNPHFVFIVSMIGILVTTTALYYFSDILGFSEKLTTRYPNKMNKWKNRLNSPKSTLFVMVWSFFH